MESFFVTARLSGVGWHARRVKVKVKVSAQYVPSLAAVSAVFLVLRSSSLLSSSDRVMSGASRLGAVAGGGRLAVQMPGVAWV